MTTLNRSEVEARSYELDPYGHLNNAVYINWLEHGRLGYLRDRLVIESRIERFGTSSFTFAQQIRYRDGRIAAGGAVTMVCVEAEGRSVPMPAPLRERLEGSRLP